MEALVVIATALVLLVAMPVLISRMMSRARRKRQMRAFGMGFEGAFDVLDPAKARAK
jgi:Flp pilus assembly protein TadB